MRERVQEDVGPVRDDLVARDDRGAPATAPAGVPVWGDPRAWGNPPVLEGEVAADVCVVGLGGSGLAAVGALLEAGATVAAVDAGPVGGGAAGRNGGFLLAGTARFHHDAVATWGRERAVALYESTVAEMDRLEAELGGAVIRRVGSLRVPASPEEAEDCARQREALVRDGFAAEAAPGPSGEGVLVPGDGALHPLARCRVLAGRALAAGARLFCGSPVLGVTGDRVSTAAGAVGCRAVVVAVDGGLERLLPELADRARSTRLQMLATAPVAAGIVPRPVYDNWGHDYWQQLPDGRIALGGGRDRFEEAEWGRPPEPEATVQAWLDRLLHERVGIDAPVTHRWAGEVAYTEDKLPILEDVRPGVVATGALNGHGNVLGSAAARAAAAIALGAAPLPLARLLRPEVWE
jgi:gamma-glutamylputrescine oxidase